MTTTRPGTIAVQRGVSLITHRFVDYLHDGPIGPELACTIGDGGTLIVHDTDSTVHMYAPHAWHTAEITYDDQPDTLADAVRTILEKHPLDSYTVEQMHTALVLIACMSPTTTIDVVANAIDRCQDAGTAIVDRSGHTPTVRTALVPTDHRRKVRDNPQA